MFDIHSFAFVPILAQVAEGAGTMIVKLDHVLAVVVYSLIGVIVLGGCFWLMKRMMPFSVAKEIEEDQNVALAIIMGAVIIGMSIIIAAAIL